METIRENALSERSELRIKRLERAKKKTEDNIQIIIISSCIIWFWLLLITVMLFATQVKAEEPPRAVKVNLYLVTQKGGLDNPSREDMLLAFEETKTRYAALTISLTLRSFTRIRDRARRKITLKNYPSRVLLFAKKVKKGQRRTINYFGVPLVRSGGFQYHLGAAEGVCKIKSGTAYSTLQHSPADGGFSNVIGMTHEMGHLLGAYHVNDNSVMNPNAFSVASLAFSFTTVLNLLFCLY